MSVNNIQIGGNHYQKTYQHWDFAIDTDMPYLLGCATKYPTRWKEKNGTQDLRKSVHYLEKAMESGIRMPVHLGSLADRFCEQLGTYESTIVQAICSNYFSAAINLLNELIVEAESNPNFIKG